MVTSNDLKKDAEEALKFKVKLLTNQLNLVSRDEFDVQKKIIEKLKKDLEKLKIKKTKKKL